MHRFKYMLKRFDFVCFIWWFQKIFLSLQPDNNSENMLVLKDCINKLAAFKEESGKQFGITKIGIFGSVARQENTEDSDIDIVVEIEKPTISIMYELRERLTSIFRCNVDLIRFRPSLRPLFKSNIINDVVYV